MYPEYDRSEGRVESRWGSRPAESPWHSMFLSMVIGSGAEEVGHERVTHSHFSALS